MKTRFTNSKMPPCNLWNSLFLKIELPQCNLLAASEANFIGRKTALRQPNRGPHVATLLRYCIVCNNSSISMHIACNIQQRDDSKETAEALGS